MKAYEDTKDKIEKEAPSASGPDYPDEVRNYITS